MVEESETAREQILVKEEHMQQSTTEYNRESQQAIYEAANSSVIDETHRLFE